MKTNIGLFWIICAFYLASTVMYLIWGLLAEGEVEWVGVIGMLLAAALGAMIATFLGMTHKAQGGELPEDTATADIDDGDPEVGHFSPWSWWPITLAAALSISFLGIAVGTWLTFIGLPLVAVAMVGWVYEYYRGYFAR